MYCLNRHICIMPAPDMPSNCGTRAWQSLPVFTLLCMLTLLSGCSLWQTAETHPEPVLREQTLGMEGLCPPPDGEMLSPECAADMAALSHVVYTLTEARNGYNVPGIMALYAEEARIMTWLDEEQRDTLVPRARFAALLPGKVAGWRDHKRIHTLLAPPSLAVTGDTARAEFDLMIEEGGAQATGHFMLALQRSGSGWLIAREAYAQID